MGERFTNCIGRVVEKPMYLGEQVGISRAKWTAKCTQSTHETDGTGAARAWRVALSAFLCGAILADWGAGGSRSSSLAWPTCTTDTEEEVVSTEADTWSNFAKTNLGQRLQRTTSAVRVDWTLLTVAVVAT